jgi:hypothetical protein
MAEHHRTEHDLFAQLFGFGFHHHHRVSRAGHDEVEVAFRHLVELRIEHIFIVDEADARGGDRPHEGHAGEGERRRSGHHGDNVGIVLKIVRQRGDGHLGVAAIALGEQRADGAVDQARRQSLLLGRAAFAFEITAWDAARGVELLLVIDGERKEIDAFLWLLRGNNGGQYLGFAVGGEHGAVGETGYLSGLEGELAPAPIELNAMDIEHFGRLSWFRRKRKPEQDGERLRAPNARQQHPAILPWLSCLPRFHAGASPASLEGRPHCRPTHWRANARSQTHGYSARNLAQRRMPSFSMIVL